MRYAKLFSLLVAVVIGLYGSVGLYFLPFAGFEGDLTRVAMLPESMFGWTKPQPAIDPALLRSASWQEADVLVVGDSFSEPRIWQTVLVKHGLKVRTHHWTSVRGVCEDFYPWLRSQGFHGKIVIFEVVERNLEGGLPNSVSCKKLDYHPSVEADQRVHPPRVQREQTDRSGRLSVGLQTLSNSLHYQKISTASDFAEWVIPSGAKVHRIPQGCQKFSHAQCQDALFYSSDRVTDLPDSTVDSIATLNSRLGDITPIWVFMPDKSTVYLHPDKQFWNKVEQRFNAPNVLSTMRAALARGVIDLYPANNSHLSTTGYLLLGDLVYEKIAALPNTPQR